MFSAEPEKCVYLETFYTIPTASQEAGSLLATGLSPGPAWSCRSAASTCELPPEACLFMLGCIISFPTGKAALLSCEAEIAERPLTYKSTQCPLPNTFFVEHLLCFLFTSCLAFSPCACSFFSPKHPYRFSLLYPTSNMISRDHPTSHG